MFDRDLVDERDVQKFAETLVTFKNQVKDRKSEEKMIEHKLDGKEIGRAHV